MDEQSRNSWINKDEPTDVSSMAKRKDGFEDILEVKKQMSDLKYCLRARNDVPMYKYCYPRTPTGLKTDVLNSDRVKYRIEMVAQEMGISIDQVRQEASSILDEMAHNLSLGAVRSFAFVLIKVFKALFHRVYVNDEGVQQLRRLVHEYPVVLMPSHRSYMDFLLVSYIFYDQDLPLPVIAAAMDFKGMKFFGWLLRQCGAFYIRRSFGSDALYWAVFTEYVQTQLRNGDGPVEFFVEGTRSRTGKSYTPKIGMLSAALESYFKAELPDIMIVPISISYERILEESLYAYEMLGVPKPKESASGVFKARKILEEDFGSVHFHIDDPISIRQFSTSKIDRVVHALEPRYINNLTAEEAEITRQLAFTIVRRQQAHSVTSPWSLMATVLVQNPDGIPVRRLVKEVEWLKRQAANLGAYVDWPGNASSESVVRYHLSLHSNVVNVSRDDVIELKVERPSGGQARQLRDVTMVNAATHIILGSYRNQLMHVFLHVAMIALSVNSCPHELLSLGDLFEKYAFLEKMFSREFVFQPGNTKKDFEHALLTLRHSGALVIEGNHVVIKRSINKHSTFLSHMFEPFLLAYWILCHHLLSLKVDLTGRALPKKPKEVAKDAQSLAVTLLQEGAIKHYEVLSLDIIGNGLSALTSLSAMYRDKRNEEPYVSPNHVAVTRIADKIAKFLDLPQVCIQDFLPGGKQFVLPASKM